MDRQRPLVSVIIPVFNIKAYLEDSITSVMRQTYGHLEILIVDDGSTDGSGIVCERFAEVDERIRVIHQPNGGPAKARNTALDVAQGEYIYYLDGDDIAHSRAIEFLLQALMSCDADLAISGAIKFQKDHEESKEDGICESLSSTETVRRMLFKQGFEHAVWGKLYRRRLWEEIRFPEGQLFEDFLTTYRILALCEKCVYYSIPLTFYRIRPGSIMHSNTMDSAKLRELDVADEVTEYIKKQFPETAQQAEYRRLMIYIKVLKNILDTGFASYPEQQKRIMELVRSSGDLVRMPWATGKDIIKFRSLKVSKRLFYLVYLLGDFLNRRKLR